MVGGGAALGWQGTEPSRNFCHVFPDTGGPPPTCTQFPFLWFWLPSVNRDLKVAHVVFQKLAIH